MPSSSLAFTAGIMGEDLLFSGSNTWPCRYRSAILLRLRKAWRRSFASSICAICRPLTFRMALAPGSDIHLQACRVRRLRPTAEKWLLSRPASFVVRLPIRLSRSRFAKGILHDGHILFQHSQRHFRNVFRDHELGLGGRHYLGDGNSRAGLEQGCAAIRECDHRQLGHDQVHGARRRDEAACISSRSSGRPWRCAASPR